MGLVFTGGFDGLVSDESIIGFGAGAGINSGIHVAVVGRGYGLMKLVPDAGVWLCARAEEVGESILMEDVWGGFSKLVPVVDPGASFMAMVVSRNGASFFRKGMGCAAVMLNSGPVDPFARAEELGPVGISEWAVVDGLIRSSCICPRALVLGAWRNPGVLLDYVSGSMPIGAGVAGIEAALFAG